MKSCLSILIVALIALVGVFWFGASFYAIFTPDSAQEYSVFHMTTILSEAHYVVLSPGVLSTRLFMGGILLVLISIVVVLVYTGVDRMISEDKQGLKRSAAQLFLVMLVAISVFVGYCVLTVPKQAAVFDTQSKSVIIREYGDLFFIRSPKVQSERLVPFGEVKNVVYRIDEEAVRGGDYIESMLFLVTETDTTAIGRAVLYGGELAWLTDWRSREQIIEEGRDDSRHAAEDLINLIRRE